MPRQSVFRKPVPRVREGPVKPDSTLYRVLQMIAKEVAKTLADQPSAHGRQ